MVQHAALVSCGPLFVATLLLVRDASAQTGIHHFVGSVPGEQFGWSVASLADVDGDGVDDVAASSTLAGLNRGVVRVYSGATGTLRWEVQGDVAGQRFGHALAGLGDVDGDGRSDLAVGAYLASFTGAVGAGSVRVYSGASGALVREHRGDSGADHFGWSVANAGDVDADGVDDLIVGAIDDDNAGLSSGSARVHSGASGATILTVSGTTASQVCGWSVSGAGDVNGDGRADLLVGAPYTATSVQPGIARLHSGANGLVLFAWAGTQTADSFGSSVAGLGDVDGDDVPDLIVGARQLGPNTPGYARVMSGASGALLYTLAGDATHRDFGHAVAAAGDVDYDGRGDFLVGTPFASDNGTNSGIARLYSGASGVVLHDFRGATGAQLGGSIAAGGDQSGNGAPDVILGAIGDATGGNMAGGVFVFTGSDVPPPSSADPLEADVLEVSLALGTMQQLALDAGVEHAGREYVILGSASGTAPGFTCSGLSVALNPDAYMLFSLLVPRRAPLQDSRGTLDLEGKASASFRPARAWRASCLVGRTFHHAYLVLGGTPRALFASNTVSVTITP